MSCSFSRTNKVLFVAEAASSHYCVVTSPSTSGCGIGHHNYSQLQSIKMTLQQAQWLTLIIIIIVLLVIKLSYISPKILNKQKHISLLMAIMITLQIVRTDGLTPNQLHHPGLTNLPSFIINSILSLETYLQHKKTFSIH